MSSLRGAAIAIGLLMLLAAPTAASAAVIAPPSHPFLFTLEGFVQGLKFVPPPEGEYEDACGLARDSAGDIYIADYYHRLIYVYGPGQEYLTQFADPDPDGPCNLAVDAAGDVYVNNWHRNVVEFTPSHYPPSESTTYQEGTTIDSVSSTGLAIDPADDRFYVDDRTYVAVYEPSGEPVLSGGEPLRIGLDPLASYYGVAISDFGPTAGKVYVPNAVSDTVAVFGPAGEALGQVDGLGTPQRGFRSLIDANAAIDPTDGHLFVADDLEPGFEHPAMVVDEFNSAGEYRGQLPRAMIDAEPSQLLVDPAGNVYASSGNDEKAQVFAFGPTLPADRLQVSIGGAGSGAVTSEPAGIDCLGACAAEFAAGSEVVLTAVPEPGSAFAGWSGGGCAGTAPCHLTMGAETAVSAEFEPAAEPLALLEAGPPATGAALGPPAPAQRAAARPTRTPTHHPTAQQSEIKQKGNLRVSFEGKLTPHALPRHGTAPVKVAVGARIAATDGKTPPQLRKIQIAINRNGRFEPDGLPRCALRQIQPATTADALAACRAALVGQGSFSAKVLLPQQAPFPSQGKVFAFNGTYKGRPAILAHVYGTRPVPTSYTIPFEISPAKGTFGTVLRASLPQVTSEWGYVTGLKLTLGRTFSFHGQRRSYLSAACPAPKGFPGAVFPFARASFAFRGRGTLTSTLTRSCGVRG
jgi:DNA-binding beta-propeller fold protein YncE